MEETDPMFSLESDETYEKICGQVLLTTYKRLAIHCTECEKYFYFDDYVNHFEEYHYDDKTSISKTELDFIESTDNTMDNVEVVQLADEDECFEFVKKEIDEEFYEYKEEIEIETLDEEALKEEELPIYLLKEPKKKKPSITIQKPSEVQMSKTQKPSRLTNNTKTQPQKILNETKRPKPSEEKSLHEEYDIPDVVRDVQRRTNWVATTSIPEEQRKHKCPICGLAFKDKYNVRHHVIRHSGKKDFECPICKKKFYTSSEVKTHSRFHTQDRDYLCSDCGRSFKTKFQLKNHNKRHLNVRDYKCKFCDKAYFDSHTLKDHMHIHSKEKRISCEICGGKFSRPIALKNHMKLHENKREYKCNICDAGFNQKAGLFSHLKITHKKT